jgi:RNA polymerase sigma-70 factor (ECF subfamily)
MGQVVPLKSAQTLDAELVARCLRGEADAWRELYVTHVDRVGRFLRRMGVRPADLEDVLQETFVALHGGLSAFDPRFPLRTWLLGIAMNQVKSQRRRIWRRRVARLVGFEGFGDPDAPSLGESLERREAARELQWILDRMSEKQREVFVLYEVEGLEGPAIARMLGCSVNTVWSRARLAREDFRRLLRQRAVVRGGGE